MPSQSTSVHPSAGLPVITTRPVFGNGWLVSRLVLPFLVFISVHAMIAGPWENTTGLLWPLL